MISVTAIGLLPLAALPLLRRYEHKAAGLQPPAIGRAA